MPGAVPSTSLPVLTSSGIMVKGLLYAKGGKGAVLHLWVGIFEIYIEMVIVGTCRRGHYGDVAGDALMGAGNPEGLQPNRGRGEGT